MKEAGYTKQETDKIRIDVGYFESIRSEIKLASGDYIDLKAYEPAMRHLIDSYIDAEESRKVSAFDNLTLIDLIINKGISAIDSLPKGIKENKTAVAETIENNVRKLIIDEKPTNPKYYERMSVLLDEIIRARKQEAIEYAVYLKEIEELSKKLKNTTLTDSYPKSIGTKAKRALYDNLDNNEKLALKVHENIDTRKSEGWRGTKIKERQLKLAITAALEEFGVVDEKKTDEILELAKNQDEY